MASEAVARFITGLIKSKKKKEEKEKKLANAEAKAAKTAKEKEHKAKVTYYKDIASANPDSELGNWATQFAQYWQGQVAGENTVMPSPPPEIADALRQVKQGAAVTEVDPMLTSNDEQKEEIRRAHDIKRRYDEWWNSLTPVDQNKIEKRRRIQNLPTGSPTIEQIMQDTSLYEDQLETHKKELTTAGTDVSTQKAEYEHEKSSLSYREGLEQDIDAGFARIYLKMHIDKLDQQGISYDLQEQLEMIRAMRASPNQKTKPIYAPIDDEGMDSLFDKLVMYERLFGEQYSVYDQMWDNKIFDPNLEIGVYQDDSGKNFLAKKGAKGQPLYKDGISLRDLYSSYGIDNNETIDDPAGTGGQVRNPNFKKPVEKINEYISDFFPKVYSKVQIVDKERQDYEEALTKRADIQKKIKSLSTSVLNLKFQRMGYVPSKDTRDKIKDTRQKIKNPTYGQNIEVENKDYGSPIPNPAWDADAAEEARKANTPYIDERETIDDGVGNQMPNPFYNKEMQENIMDWRAKILQKDDVEWKDNSDYGEMVDNPGKGLALTQYPYLQDEEDE